MTKQKRMTRFDQTAYLFVGALFLCLVARDLFSEGMFLDGTTYAALANNMAKGMGSFWRPYLSDTLYPVFYEHPPLALGLQSVWFRVFGDGIYVERFYSLFTYVLTGGLITAIWKEVTGSFRFGWFPLLLWIAVPDVLWAASNNMLENTMGVFTTSAAWFYFKYRKRNGVVPLVLVGICLCLGLLTKGFFCLYLWGLPFFDWLFTKRGTVLKASTETLIIALASALPIAILYFVSEGAEANMDGYISEQLVSSFRDEVTVDSRASILINFLERILPSVLIALIVIWLGRKKKFHFESMNGRLPFFWLFLALCLSGVFPIMISLKQRSFYILTVYPFFALGLGYLITPVLENVLERVKLRTLQVFQGTTVILIGAGWVIAVLQIGNIGRNESTLHDVKSVINLMGEGSVINVCPQLWEDWGLNAYFARYGHVSLEPRLSNKKRYYLSLDGCISSKQPGSYQKVDLPLEKYDLFERVGE